MDILNNIAGGAGDNKEMIESAIDKVGDLVDEKTGGAYAEQVDTAQDFVKGQLGIDTRA